MKGGDGKTEEGSGIKREDPGGLQGALSGGHGPRSWEDYRRHLHKKRWSGQRVA